MSSFFASVRLLQNTSMMPKEEKSKQCINMNFCYQSCGRTIRGDGYKGGKLNILQSLGAWNVKKS